MHIIFMETFLFKIIKLYSLRDRLMVDGKVTLRKYCNKPKWSKWSILQDNYFYAFKREFPICDVAQGLIGDPLILSKGNPPCLTILLFKEND